MKSLTTKKIQSCLLKRECLLWSLSLSVLVFLVFSYAFLLFSSVSVGYALESGERELAQIHSENSMLESKFAIKKEEVLESGTTTLVLARDIEYVDSSFEKLVFNR